METRTRTWVVVVAVVIATLIAVPSLTSTTPPGTAIDGRLEIVMQDYGFEVDEWHLPAGRPLELIVVNRDEVSHPLSFGRAEIEDELLRTVGYAEDLFAGLSPRVAPTTAVVAPTPPDQSFTVQVPGESTDAIEVELPEDRMGTWNTGCFLARGCHYAAGLSATLVVTP